MNKISIKPEREYLREVANKIRSGEYAIPAFQRNFVWKPAQIIDLFDSILNGFPIGTLILWKPLKDEIPPVKDIVTETISENPDAEHFILDGRQRCTAFYCCVNDIEGKSPCFKLYYNLEKNIFEYANKQSNLDQMVLVSEVYDTFKMLNLLQSMMLSVKDEKLRLKYITNIKELNAALQSYEITEVFISNCSLDDSSNVFSRINSKGTDISAVEMIQAVSYKNKKSVLIASEIKDLIESFDVYGFQDMKSDDVLNCCYKYIGKNYFDNKVMKLLMDSDLDTIVPQLKDDVKKAVEFLHDECNVISYRLLPYNRQLIAAANFFRVKKDPSREELAELKKWIYYTSFKQTFLNGSLGNIRDIFSQFDSYLNGTNSTLINYERVNANLRLDFKFASGSALSNFIVMCIVGRMCKNAPELFINYNGIYRYKGDKPANSFVLFDDKSKGELINLLKGRCNNLNLGSFLLDDEMVKRIQEGNMNQFIALRKKAIIELIKETFDELGIDYYEDIEVDSEEAITNILSDFDELNKAEKVELCEILQNGQNAHSVIFDVTRNNDNTITINCPSFQQAYIMNETIMKKCLNAIENEYCNGENPVMYYNWLITLDKDD